MRISSYSRDHDERSISGTQGRTQRLSERMLVSPIFLAAWGYPDLLSVLATYRAKSYPRAIFPSIPRFPALPRRIPLRPFFPSSIYVSRTHLAILMKMREKLRNRGNARDCQAKALFIAGLIRRFKRKL